MKKEKIRIEHREESVNGVVEKSQYILITDRGPNGIYDSMLSLSKKEIAELKKLLNEREDI